MPNESEVNHEGWKSPASWHKVRQGMSEGQVRAILGPPHEQQGSIWYYKGTVEGEGEITGNVRFASGQVYSVHPPHFSQNHRPQPVSRHRERRQREPIPETDVGLGDVVRLKGIPGPLMLVVSEPRSEKNEVVVYCQWFDKDNRLQGHLFGVDFLEKANG